MTNNGKPQPLAVIVGARLKAFRELHQLRQSDLAAAAADVGLKWSRSSIAALEAGTRNLSIEELILLPMVISAAGGLAEPFIPPESLVLLSGRSHVRAESIADSFSALTRGAILKRHHNAAVTPKGEGYDVLAGADPADYIADSDWELGEIGDGREGYLSVTKSLRTQVSEFVILKVVLDLYGDLDIKRLGLFYAPNYDLQSKVARRLQVPESRIDATGYIKPFSAALWGRTFESERDARAARRGPYQSLRSEQSARGHVTREMLNELNEAIAQSKVLLAPLLQEMEAVWEDVGRLNLWGWGIAHSLDMTDLTEADVKNMPAVGEAIATARQSQSMSAGDVASKAKLPIFWLDWLEAGLSPLTTKRSTLLYVISEISTTVGLDAAVVSAKLKPSNPAAVISEGQKRGLRRKRRG